MSTTSAFPALGLAAVLALGVTTGASAAPAAQGVTEVAEAAAPVRPVAATEGEDESGTCSRIRRRLWVEGEGWIVRRVTTCR